jgi:hypothetical protein
MEEQSKPITKYDCINCNVRGWVSSLDKKVWALVMLALVQLSGIIMLIIKSH